MKIPGDDFIGSRFLSRLVALTGVENFVSDALSTVHERFHTLLNKTTTRHP